MIKKELQKLPRTTVAGSPVHYYKTKDNRGWIELLLKTLKKLGLTKEFALMIDASAGDLFSKQKYHLSLTEKKKHSPEEFFDYWVNLLKTYPIQILEDPFAESDWDNWRQLTQKFPKRIIAGDNLFATDPEKIKRGAKMKLASATLIKPNQIGTISEAVEAIKIAFRGKILPITSHRSIETESTILTDLTIAFNIPMVKIGLFSDFETIIKLNKMLRYDVYPNSS